MATFIIIEEDTLGHAVLTFDLNPIVIGEKYAHADQAKFTITKSNAFRADPMDRFVYSVEVDGVKSQNTAVKEIIYPVDGTIPATSLEAVSADLNEEINITDHIPYEDGFDRIIITAIEGKGTWTYENGNIAVGQELFYFMIFDKIKYYTDSPGAGDDYAVLTYKKATKDTIFPDDNTITINTTSLAILQSDLVLEPVTEGALTGFEFYFEIQNQIVNKDFVVRITTSITNLGSDPDDAVTIEYAANTETYTANSVYSITDNNPSENGSMQFYGKVLLAGTYQPGDYIEVKLMSIDGNAALVDPDVAKNTLTFNLS